jgi:hypothetical protein
MYNPEMRPLSPAETDDDGGVEVLESRNVTPSPEYELSPGDVRGALQALKDNEQLIIGTSIGVDFTVKRDRTRGWVITEGIMPAAEGSGSNVITIENGNLMLHGQNKGRVVSLNGRGLTSTR